MEKKGIRTERSELNRQIKADNKALRELKATISRLLKAAKEKLSLPAIAEAMDKLRTRMIETMFYHMRSNNKIQEIEDGINSWEPDIKCYFEIGGEIKTKKEVRQKISQTRKETSLFSPFERHDLKREETALTEEIEELKSERTGILSRNFMNDKADMKKARATISSWKSSKETIEKYNKTLAAGIQKDAQEHQALRDSVSSEERPTLDRMCAMLYQNDKYNRRDHVQEKLSGEFDHDLYWQAEERIDDRLGVDIRMESEIEIQLDIDRYHEQTINRPLMAKRRDYDMKI